MTTDASGSRAREMRTCVRELFCCAVLGVALLATWVALRPVQVRADAPQSLTGTWQAGATSMQVTVESWGGDCGPQPQSSQSAGGGSVTLEQTGQVLVIHARGHEVRSDRCWSPNPTLRRVTTSYANGLWTTRCQTPAGDPRQEQGSYTLKLIAVDRLLYQDVSHFNWRLNQSTCAATITTTQTLHRGAAASDPTATPAATTATAAAKPTPSSAPADPVPATCVPKAAARLSLRPRNAEIALGDRVCFHARTVDAKGCPLPEDGIKWSLKHPRGLRASLEGGCLQAGQSSAESEGEFRVVAARGRLRAEAKVKVAAESLTSLLAKRLQAGAIEGSTVAAPVEVPPRRPRRRLPCASRRARSTSPNLAAPSAGSPRSPLRSQLLRPRS